jgi:hypothetical protein
LAVKLYSTVRREIRRFLQHNTPACRDMTRLMSQSMERRLSLRGRITLRLHLFVCLRCVRYLRQILTLRKVMRNSTELLVAKEPAPTLSPDARERMKTALRQKSL